MSLPEECKFLERVEFRFSFFIFHLLHFVEFLANLNLQGAERAMIILSGQERGEEEEEVVFRGVPG